MTKVRQSITFMKNILLFILAALTTTMYAAETEKNLRKHENYLASDAQEGRGIGTKGLERSALYIEQQFREVGLKPAFGSGFMQPFELGWGVTLGSNNKLAFGNMIMDTSNGIMPFGFSAAGNVSGSVKFAGYGIIAPEYQYDDFAEINVEGSIVLCMTAEPGEFDSTSKFSGMNSTPHSVLRTKAANAKLKGAAAILIVEGPLYANNSTEKFYAPRADEPYMDCGIPALRLTREAVKKLFPEFELEKLQRSIDSNTAPRSMAVTADTARVFISADIQRKSVTVENVGGIIPGDSTLIVVGAHYDHLGYGQHGSLSEHSIDIHNGADDNASGTSAIIEAARLLKNSKLKSTVMFVAFTAEETGLGGSGYLVKHFPYNIKNVRAMINLDMVGRMTNNKLTVQGCKTATEFEKIVSDANQSVGLDIVCKGDGYGPSDHMSFYLAEIPVLFLFTGAHEDYHKPSDDIDKINFAGLESSTKLTVNLVAEIDKHTQPLSYVKTAEPPAPGGRFRTYFGSIPDYSQPDTLIGVLLGGTREGSPANKAGLKGGDVLIKMGNVKINNIYDFVFALKTYAPGDSVEIHYMRENKEQTTQAILEAPKQ